LEEKDGVVAIAADDTAGSSNLRFVILISFFRSTHYLLSLSDQRLSSQRTEVRVQGK
jgi:hypothetical protein